LFLDPELHNFAFDFPHILFLHLNDCGPSTLTSLTPSTHLILHDVGLYESRLCLGLSMNGTQTLNLQSEASELKHLYTTGTFPLPSPTPAPRVRTLLRLYLPSRLHQLRPSAHGYLGRGPSLSVYSSAPSLSFLPFFLVLLIAWPSFFWWTISRVHDSSLSHSKPARTGSSSSSSA